jgi:hypothetical protein
MRGTDPDAKARLSDMRRAGHYWGSRLAEMVIAEIAKREAALREIGANDEHVEAWVAAFSKQFIARIVSHIGRLASRSIARRDRLRPQSFFGAAGEGWLMSVQLAGSRFKYQ